MKFFNSRFTLQGIACKQAFLFGQAKCVASPLARSREARFTRPNRRACSQAIQRKETIFSSLSQDVSAKS